VLRGAKRDASVRVVETGHETLGNERSDLFRREVDDRNDELALEVGKFVEIGDLRAGLLGPISGPKSIRSL